MKVRIAKENKESESLIPPAEPDNSGVGVNYADAYLKGLNVSLEDGRVVTFKRKGLKITLSVGTASGEALMRKREHGPDVKQILRHTLEEAATKAGCAFLVESGDVYLDLAS
jgi:hypothetical protein